MSKKLGYKVMPIENGHIVSGANKRLGEMELRVGANIEMPGNGIYMSPLREYVLSHYSGLADEEVLITFLFDTDEMVTGNLEDAEPEISVRKAKIMHFQAIIDGELQPDEQKRSSEVQSELNN